MDDCVVLGDASTRIHQPIILRLTACDLAWFGADISEHLDDSVSHVVVNSRYGFCILFNRLESIFSD
jgi:hypothetical protein